MTKNTDKAKEVKQRLEHIRAELRAERISYDELHELQSLAEHIPADDVELREAAGLPEFPIPADEPSPLPWEYQRGWGNNSGFVIEGVAHVPREANARLIVASVNHAAQLAEALRHLMAITYNDNALQYREAREALAAWETAQ